MKTASLAVAAVGVLALLMGMVERVLHFTLLGAAPRGFLGLATALFLLALVLIEYDRAYGAEKKAPTQ